MLSVISGLTAPGWPSFSISAEQVGGVAREVVVARVEDLQLELDADRDGRRRLELQRLAAHRSSSAGVSPARVSANCTAIGPSSSRISTAESTIAASARRTPDRGSPCPAPSTPRAPTSASARGTAAPRRPGRTPESQVSAQHADRLADEARQDERERDHRRPPSAPARCSVAPLSTNSTTKNMAPDAPGLERHQLVALVEVARQHAEDEQRQQRRTAPACARRRRSRRPAPASATKCQRSGLPKPARERERRQARRRSRAGAIPPAGRPDAARRSASPAWYS